MVTNSHDTAQAESDPVETTFELNDTLYCKASIPPTEEIYLWLGVCRGPRGKPILRRNTRLTRGVSRPT